MAGRDGQRDGTSPGARVRRTTREFFALDDDWERPTPRVGWADLFLAGFLAVLGVVMLELIRSVGGFVDVDDPAWAQRVAVVSGAAMLCWRRRFPLMVGALSAGHMFVVGLLMPGVMGQLPLQICYFVALLSAVAWARHRRAALVVASGIVLFMLVWVAWQFANSSAAQRYVDAASGGPGELTSREGWFAPIPSAVAIAFVVNTLYFVGAVIGGQVAWRGARQRARLQEQARTIEAQADDLRRRAVVDERLRIARELHDVVGHHVSVIGIQAAGARKVIEHDREQAAEALTRIEEASREGVSEMRHLLGTLRDPEVSPDPGTPATRDPGQDISDLPGLAEERSRTGLPTTYTLVEQTPGAAGAVGASVGRSVYRIAQEALANTAKHSTATSASLVLRVRPRQYVELEVLDDGRPRAASLESSGLGQLGIRERVASHNGVVEIGPRVTGGYRVRVRIPLGVGRTGGSHA